MKKFKVVIPEEKFSVANYTNNNLPAIAVVNTPLLKFKQKKIFSFSLIISIEFKDAQANGMPSSDELKEIEKFEDMLTPKLIEDLQFPNALFLARITWNGARDLFFYVRDPEKAHEYLQKVFKQKDRSVKLDYLMQQDKDWSTTKWMTRMFKKAQL